VIRAGPKACHPARRPGRASSSHYLLPNAHNRHDSPMRVTSTVRIASSPTRAFWPGPAALHLLPFGPRPDVGHTVEAGYG
jgi:hypothetical protein